jgi:tRNA/rRNA methyltransferase
MIKPVYGPREAVKQLHEAFAAKIPCGILFGRERWGLKNEEVALAQGIITFPVNPGFASLNLAQAVLLVAYEWMAVRAADRPAFSAPMPEPASHRDLVGLMEHLESALDETNYFHPPEKREKMALNLRTILSKSNLTEPEVRTLRGVIASLQRRWLRRQAD